MAGLFDEISAFASTPQGQGLLAATFGGLAGARRGQPINSIGRAGLAGLAGYSGAQDREMQMAENAKQNQMRDMQIKAYEQTMSAAQRKALEDERIKSLITSQFAPVTGVNANAVSGVTGPRPEAAAMIGQTPARPNYQRLIALGVPADTAKALAEAENYGRPKVARTAEVEGPNGTKRIVQLDEYGQEVGGGMSGYVAPVLVDTGDKKVFSKPNAGQEFRVNMSPGELAANARGWADIKTKQDANDINRTAARTQVVEGADGNVYLVDKGTGISRPTATLGGTNVRAGKAAEDGMKRERDAKDGLELIDMARKLLPGATGSGVGASADAAGRYFGITSEGAKKAAQLEALGGQMVMKMPRMEGPQSNLDQLLYREMAGKIGDRTVPVAEREAALKTVEGLYQKYGGGTAAKPAPAGLPADIANILNRY